MQDPSLVERSEKKPKAWADIVEYVLSHPCFPLFMPNAPHELPPVCVEFGVNFNHRLCIVTDSKSKPLR